MKNILFVLGGGALVYWYMCNSKKYNCNCKGDIALDLGNKIKEAGEESAKYINEAILEKDGSYVNKPVIGSYGERRSVYENTGESEMIPMYDRGNYLSAFNMRGVRNNVSSLYKRYNTSKQAITSPSRVRVIVID